MCNQIMKKLNKKDQTNYKSINATQLNSPFRDCVKVILIDASFNKINTFEHLFLLFKYKKKYSEEIN